MTSSKIACQYYQWMVDAVVNKSYGSLYSNLLKELDSIDYYYTLPMDENRQEDGFNLRYQFAYEMNAPYYEVADAIDDRPCSVLEMMVALSLRCGETIMYDPEEGAKTEFWFWKMVESLGLIRMTDTHFDEMFVQERIERFLHQDYERNGAGGLFTVQQPYSDMRRVDIWTQMNWYLEELTKGDYYENDY